MRSHSIIGDNHTSQPPALSAQQVIIFNHHLPRHLVIPSIGRIAIPVPSSTLRSRRRSLPTEPALLSLGLGAHFDFTDFAGSRVPREGIGISLRVILLATPEHAATSPSVVVGWGGTESLLALVVAAEEDIEED